MKTPSRSCNVHVHGFTLVEVTLALGIAVFCLVVVFGLLNVGINTSSASLEQTVATDILSAVASDLRAAPTPTTGTPAQTISAVYGIAIPANLAVGQSTPNPTQLSPALILDATGQVTTTSPRYQLDVWTRPATGLDATQVRLMVSWPPKAVVKSGSVETFVALDRN